MNPDDFEDKYGYDYTDDPDFDSRSDAGGGKVEPSHPELVDGIWTLMPGAGGDGGASQMQAQNTSAMKGSQRRHIEKKKTILTQKA